MKKLYAGLTVASLALSLAFCAGTQKAQEPKNEKASVGEKTSALAPASGGIYTVEHRRQCRPGMLDVSALTDAARDFVFAESNVLACGVLSVVHDHNAITNEGAADVWAVYFAASGRSAGNSWYVGLTSATPTATSTLATITEISGNGYARQPITWDFATSRHAKTGNVVFTATGAWGSGATYLFVANASSGTSGKMFNYLALSATRQPAANGDTITVSWDGNL